MAGGFSFLLGLIGLFGSSAASNYKPKKQRELESIHHELFHYEKPSREVEEIYYKWMGRYQNTRGEWPHKMCGPKGEPLSYAQSKKLWWKHIFEDEGVEVSEAYLNNISGVSDELFNDAVIRRKFR